MTGSQSDPVGASDQDESAREPVQILAISGSMRRRQSVNVRLLSAAARIAGGRAAFTDYLQSAICRLPAFAPDESPPEAVREFCGEIEQADGVLISTPEYAGSIPGAIKNAFDWASLSPAGSVLADKPVAVIGADRTDFGGDWGQAEARKILDSAGAEVVEAGFSLPHADRAFTEEGELADREAGCELGAVLNQLIAAARSQPASAAAS